MRWFLILIFPLNFIFAACTENGKLEKISLNEAQKRREIEYQMLASEAIHDREALKKEFIDYINSKTKYSAKEIKTENNSNAVVVIEVSSLPKDVRFHLAQIVGRLDAWKIVRFNFDDATRQIYSQLKIPQANLEVELVKIHLFKDVEWKVQ